MAEPNNEMDVDNPDSESELASESDEGFSLQAVGILNPSPVVPSIDDNDDGVDFDNDEAEDNKERGRKRVTCLVATCPLTGIDLDS